MKKTVLLSLFIFSTSLLFAQTTNVKRKIKADTYDPLAQGSVFAKGSKTSVLNNEAGLFTIKLKPETNRKARLVITDIKYEAQQNTVDGEKDIANKLQPQTYGLDYVVVIDYQGKSRKEITASVSSLGIKDLNDTPLNSAAEALAERLAGVQIALSDGSPGADVYLVEIPVPRAATDLFLANASLKPTNPAYLTYTAIELGTL
ncbi:MAG: hypothetical protein ABIX01_12075 [Chitinophagaceae bacterium]